MENSNDDKKQLYENTEKLFKEFYEKLYRSQEPIPENIVKVINKNWFEFL